MLSPNLDKQDPKGFLPRITRINTKKRLVKIREIRGREKGVSKSLPIAQYFDR